MIPLFFYVYDSLRFHSMQISIDVVKMHDKQKFKNKIKEDMADIFEYLEEGIVLIKNNSIDFTN